MPTFVIDWDGINGGNRIFWANMASFVSEFVKANGLRPARIGPMAAGLRRTPAKGAADVAQFLDLGIRGGMKIAHLHNANRIYLLDEKQWAKFSGKIVADARNKLDRVKEVSFDQAVMLGSVAQELSK